MDGFDGRVYFRLLAAVAAADGVIHSDERELFGQLLERAGAKASWSETLCDEAVAHMNEPLWFFPKNHRVPKETAAVYIRDALFVGLADGGLAAIERSLIQKATLIMGVEELCESVPALQGDRPITGEVSLWHGAEGSKERTPLDTALKVAGGTAIVAGTAAAGVFLAPAVMGLAAAAIGVNTIAAAGVTLLGAGVAGRALLDH